MKMPRRTARRHATEIACAVLAFAPLLASGAIVPAAASDAVACRPSSAAVRRDSPSLHAAPVAASFREGVAAQRPSPSPHSPAAVASFREGVDAQRREAWEEAARAYRRAIEVEPHFAEAHANLGAVLGRLGRYEEAVAAYERALALAPGLQTARINLGLAHYRAGEPARAVDVFGQALARDASSEQARALLGLALVDAGRSADAIPYLEAATTDAPEDPGLLFALGRAYAGSREPAHEARVEAVATRLSTLAAGRPLWYHLQGVLHQRHGRHREALAAFESAAAAQTAPPELPGLALATGISLLALGEDARAREAFERARKQAPRDAVPLFYVGWLDERAGQFAPAREAAERALTLDPDLVEARALLGRVLLGQGAFAEAARHLSMAAARDTEDASIRYLLAQAYQRAGDAAAARREFDEAKRLKARQVARERQP